MKLFSFGGARVVLRVALGLSVCVSAWADAGAPGSDEWKLTLGTYRSDADTGHDLNLRGQQGNTHFWLGGYKDRSVGLQSRAGVDTSWALVPWLALQPSLQAASGGFWGGSVNLQAGNSWYGLVGWGRTNLRPYFNLNFDPNDAYTVGAGWNGEGGRGVSATMIADDRLHTGQRHRHLTVRWPSGEGERWSFDLLRKTGQGDGGDVRAWGWTFTYDWPVWFVRIARDPQQNFSQQDTTRLSVGRRW